VRDASDVAEVSGLRNSIGAQEFGADFTEPYRIRGFDVRLEHHPLSSTVSASLGVAREWTEAVTAEAAPAQGTYRPAPAIPSGQGWRADLALAMVPRLLLGGAVHGSLGLQVRRLRDADDVSMPVRGTAHPSTSITSTGDSSCIHVRRDQQRRAATDLLQPAAR
jgi:hypothetical protein